MNNEDRLIELVLDMKAEQQAFYVQQAEEQRRNAEEQRRNAEEQRRNAEEQRRINEIVLAKLDAIEANTIIIRGAVVSDFEGVSPQTKQEIETEANEIELTENDIAVHECLVNPANKTERAKQYRQKLTTKTVGKQLAEYDSSVTHGDKAAAGNWVSSIITKIYKQNFKGKYPPKLDNLTSLLVGYYAVERESNRKY